MKVTSAIVATLIVLGFAPAATEAGLRTYGRRGRRLFRNKPQPFTIDNAVVNWWAQRDEDDDDLGFRNKPQPFTIDDAVVNWWAQRDEDDDDDLGGRFCLNCPARSGGGFTAGNGLTNPIMYRL